MVEKLRQEDLLRGEESGNLEDFLIVNVENDSVINATREKPRRPQPARKFLRKYYCTYCVVYIYLYYKFFLFCLHL